MTKVQYAIELKDQEWEEIKECNEKIYNQLQLRKEKSTFEDIVVCWNLEAKCVFFEYVC